MVRVHRVMPDHRPSLLHLATECARIGNRAHQHHLPAPEPRQFVLVISRGPVDRAHCRGKPDGPWHQTKLGDRYAGGRGLDGRVQGAYVIREGRLDRNDDD